MKKYKKEMIGSIMVYVFIVLGTTLILKNPNAIKFIGGLIGLVAISLEVKVYYMEVLKEAYEERIKKLER